MSTLESQSGQRGRSTVSLLSGACAEMPSSACRSMKGAAAAQAWGMQATG